MSVPRIAFALALALMSASMLTLLAGCSNGKEPFFQGWVEAELIFVGPDETGRIETLAVREGDLVEKGTLLFTLDADLQLADVAMQEASVKNARLAYERAFALLKTSSGTQKTLEDIHIVNVPGQADLMFCRELDYLRLEDVERIVRVCQRPYEEAITLPGASPHSRFDIQDWTPLDP